MSTIVSSIVLFLGFLLFLLLVEISRMNLSSKRFLADINFVTATGSLSNNINYYNKPKHPFYLF